MGQFIALVEYDRMLDAPARVESVRVESADEFWESSSWAHAALQQQIARSRANQALRRIAIKVSLAVCINRFLAPGNEPACVAGGASPISVRTGKSRVREK